MESVFRPISSMRCSGENPDHVGAAERDRTDPSMLQENPAVSSGPTFGPIYFSAFGVDEKLIREALSEALSQGGEYADLFFQHRVGHNFVLEDGSVNRAFKGTELGVGVRVVKGDQTGYAFTEDLSLPSIREAARTAATIAEGNRTAAPQRFHVTGSLPSRYTTSRRWDQIRAEEKLPLLTGLNDRTFSMNDAIRKVNITFGDEMSAILIADSAGRVVEDIQPMTLLYLSCVAEKNREREQNTDGVAARQDMSFYSQDRLDVMVKEAVDRTMILFEAVQAPAGEMPVVLGAGASGILLHEAI